MTSMRNILILFILLFVPVAASGVAPPVPDMPRNYVVDLANIIDNNAEVKLNVYLKELEQKTTAQVIVLTINSLEGESLEDFSIHLAHDKWKLGQKGKDNGVLLLISLNDRKYRFETGYGLEGILPDSMAGSIGRKFLVPYFRKGDYSKGISMATLAVANEIAKNSGVQISGMPQVRHYPQRSAVKKEVGIFKIIFGIVFFIAAIILFIRHPMLFMMLMLGGGGRRGWGGGGGFGGGFGGGGGGGFGGGGASGGW